MNQKSEELFQRANQHLVGGVNSPVRAFNSVGGNPLFIQSGKGIYITDVDGKKYIDLVGSYGPNILGHAHPDVLEAVNEACKKGFSYGASTEAEIELAEIICSAFPGMDKIRFVNSGTEATMSAIRLARGYTGKDKIIKFSGCYHGHSDSLLVAAGSGIATLSIPGSKGVTKNAVKDTLIAQYNDIESVELQINNNEDEIAAIIIEPVAGNMGIVLPENNFLKKLKKLTEEHNILLIIDEVMTGFRKRFGGAQTFYEVEADITCLGKIVGGGFPVGAYGARKGIMDMVAPLGPVYQAGTLSGNPIAMAAGIATLRKLKEMNPYEKLEDFALQLKGSIENHASACHYHVEVNTFGSMLSPFFTLKEIKNFEDVKGIDEAKFTKFFHALLKNGIYVPPSAFETWFLPAIMKQSDIDYLKYNINRTFQSIAI